MSTFCACKGGETNGNTGTSTAALFLGRAASLIFVPRTATDGTKNVILKSDFVNGVLPDEFVKNKINASDPSKRWYPVHKIVSSTDEKALPVNNTFDDGRNSQDTAEGIRSATYQVVEPAKYKANLDGLKCQFPDLAFFEIDDCGTLGGETNKTNVEILEPHPIARRKFYVNLTKAQGSAPQTLFIGFEYDTNSDDARECLVPSSAIELDLKDEDGLLNLLVDYSNITNTGFTASLQLEYGGFGVVIPQNGLIAADFKLTDTATGLDVAITSVTESPKGTYTFVTDPMTATNRMQLQIADNGTKYVKDGFEVQGKTFEAVA